MKSYMLSRYTLFLILLILKYSNCYSISVRPDSSGYVGKSIPAEFLTWIDDTTGYEITQWTKSGNNNHPYFTVESFIDEETVIIFSDRTGKKQLYKLNLNNGEMIQMTNAAYLNTDGIYFLPRLKTIYYYDDRNLFSLNVETLESKFIYDFSDFEFSIISFSVTCDGKFLVFSVNKKEASPKSPEYGPFAIYKFNLSDKSISPITHDLGFNIGHVQTNPVNPELIMYCWQWDKPGRPKLVGHSPIRIWWVKLDGSGGGPIPQEYGTQRTHETWSSDGELISYISKYRWGPKKGEQFIGLQSIDGKVNQTFEVRVSPAHQNLFKDNYHWIVDLYNDQPVLALLKRGKGKIEEVKLLFRHNSTLIEQESHPHPRISPEGKYVLFSSDRTGQPQVYTIKINLDKK
ncbi:MAG: hypothetical protein GYA14_01950 [Ignavibacteria bacterium]|nr:hypothetical protein [Ignavibacteria bacterium]